MLKNREDHIMEVENGQCTVWCALYRICFYRELMNWFNEIGFLPLLKSERSGEVLWEVLLQKGS